MNWQEDMQAGLLALAVIVALICAIIRITTEVVAVGETAQIEQLRRDVLRVKPGMNEDVIGQVTEVNRHIAQYRRYRATWFFRSFVPKVWERVDPITIPQYNEP